MVLKALHNDDIEADTSDEFGFVGPFYRGESLFPCKEEFSLQYIVIILTWLLFTL